MSPTVTQPLTMIDRVNAHQVIRILELHRRGHFVEQIAEQVLGSNRYIAVEKVLQAFGQTPLTKSAIVAAMAILKMMT
jgi:hypothetical protein